MGQWKEFDVIQQLRFYDRLKELSFLRKYSINPEGMCQRK